MARKNTTSSKTTKTTKTAKVAKVTKGYSKKGGPRGSIMGMPIENADHTVGEEGGKTPTPKQTTKIRTVKVPQVYTGAPIAATKVYKRTMVEFKNCDAEAWMIVNTETGTVTHANTYNGLLKASYKPETYTYPIKEKKVAAKAETMIEIESPADYPTWIIPATKTMDLLPKSLQKKVAKLRKSTKAK